MDSAIATSSAFTGILIESRVCHGGIFSSFADMQRLRFCDHVIGDLIIENITVDIDATIFWDIITVTGLLVR